MNDIKFKIDIIRYLDKTRELIKIKAGADKYKEMLKQTNNYLVPFFYKLYLDYCLLTDYAGGFAQMLLYEPDEAEDLIRKIIHACIINLSDLELNIDLIYIEPRISSLPQNINQFSQTGLYNIQGMLTGRTTPTKYTKSCIFVCIEPTCRGNNGKLIFGTNSNDRCEDCGNCTNEVIKARISGDHVLGVLMDSKCFNSVESISRCQGVLIEFRDDLYSHLELGINYNVIVKKNKYGLTAWGVQPISSSLLKFSQNVFFTSILMKKIKYIRAYCEGSPWALVNFFSSQLSLGSLPICASIQLRTALLLSLASVYSKCPVPILGIGECNSIMSTASKLSKYNLSPTVSLSTPLPGNVIVDNHAAWLDAGPLLLASQGVLYIGNIPKPGSSLYTQLLTAIESELITLCHKADCILSQSGLTYPLRTAVWINWKCNQNAKQDVHHLRTLIDIFGMPFIAEIGSDDECISTNLLLDAVGTNYVNEHTKIDDSILKDFISIVSMQEVEMSPAASSLIKNYFVASRRERPQSLPVRAIKVLTTLSEAHARLSMRRIVSFEDVIAVIFLYEESIATLFGQSLLSPPPRRVSNASDSMEYCKQMDAVLSQFSQWIEFYTTTLIGECSSDSNLI